MAPRKCAFCGKPTQGAMYCSTTCYKEGAKMVCHGCWTTPFDCVEGCGTKICTCNISTHECGAE